MSNEQKKKVLPFYVNFSIAGLSGMGSAVFVHPLEVLKFRMQLSGEKGTTLDHKSSIHAVINMAKNEKLSGFYKGITANFMRQIIFTSTRVGCYTSLVDELKKRGQSTVINNAIASMSTGAFAAFISTPTDVIIDYLTRISRYKQQGIFGTCRWSELLIAVVRMTADGRLPVESRRNYKSALDALIQIRKDEGIKGMWRGTVATMLRAMTANLTQLMSYDEAKVYMMENYNMENGLKLHTASSMISGIAYSVCSNPMDVLKTRIQQQKIVNGKAEYSGIIEVASTLVKTEGVLALWKGWPFYYLRVAPGTILLFIFMEQLRKGYEDNFIKDQ